MPTTINGIGTTYFGKKNREQYAGVCESCNNATTLSDYETGYFICILFIPIIPLGRKVILGECPVCTRHRVMSLREWEEAKENSISSGMDALATSAEDPSKAIELLGTYSAFKQYDEAKDLAAAISNSHPNDYDTMLAVGGWYEQMQMDTEADKCFDRCLALDHDCNASKQIRCITHVQKGELDEARVLADELFASDPIEFLGPMFTLVGAYTASDRNTDTYELYKEMIAGVPQLTDDSDFCKDVRKLEKQLGVTESIAPKKGFFGLFG